MRMTSRKERESGNDFGASVRVRNPALGQMERGPGRHRPDARDLERSGAGRPNAIIRRVIAVALVLTGSAGDAASPLVAHGLRSLRGLGAVRAVDLVAPSSGGRLLDAMRSAARKADAEGSAVLLHDPWCFTPDASGFERTLDALRDHECAAAVAASPATDTLKLAPPPGIIRGTVDRTAMWELRTPQAYRARDLLAALDGAHATEADAALAAGDHGFLPALLAGPVRIVALPRDAVRVQGARDERAVERLLARGG
jgi:2-C-methyl-D-erythritol 4-phosphate cytidylyltransferase